MEDLLDRHPHMAREKYFGGSFPLHDACGYEGTLDLGLVQRLISLHPPALRRRKCGHTPVTHIFKSQWRAIVRDPRWNALCVRMLELEPTAVRLVGRPTALSRTCEFIRAENLVRLLICVWPVSVGFVWKDSTGQRLPFEFLATPSDSQDHSTPNSTTEGPC